MLSMKPTLKHTVHGKTWSKRTSWNIPASEPEWLPACLDRANNMFQRDKNHASVIFGLVVMNHMLVKILLTWLITSVVLTILVQFTMKVLHGVVNLITFRHRKSYVCETS